MCVCVCVTLSRRLWFRGERPKLRFRRGFRHRAWDEAPRSPHYYQSQTARGAEGNLCSDTETFTKYPRKISSRNGLEHASHTSVVPESKIEGEETEATRSRAAERCEPRGEIRKTVKESTGRKPWKRISAKRRTVNQHIAYKLRR